MIFNGYCPLIEKQISEGRHIEVVAELVGLKKREDIKKIKKDFLYATYDDMLRICEGCPNFIA